MRKESELTANSWMKAMFERQADSRMYIEDKTNMRLAFNFWNIHASLVVLSLSFCIILIHTARRT